MPKAFVPPSRPAPNRRNLPYLSEFSRPWAALPQLTSAAASTSPSPVPCGAAAVDHVAISFTNAVLGLPAALLYLVIVLWLIAESCAVPIPNEASLLFSGFMVATGHLHLVGAWAAAVAGTVGGATISWWIARTFGPAGVRKVGRYVFLTPGRLAAAQAFF